MRQVQADADAPSASSPRCHLVLRRETREAHAQVDAAFGRFDLADRGDYRRFLRAHARILPVIERLTDPASRIAGWQGRAAALADDLAALGAATPAPLDVALPPGDAAAWGALYVLEGSRLGGAMLARRVGAGLPVAYLAAAHVAGGWQRTLAAIDAAVTTPADLAGALAGARATFAAYARAAATEAVHGG